MSVFKAARLPLRHHPLLQHCREPALFRADLLFRGKAVLIILGITLVSHHGGAVADVRLFNVIYPLLASLLGGFSQILRKFGLAAVPHPFLAAAVTATTSFVISILTLWLSGKREESLVLNRECLPFFIGAGIAVSLGMVSIYCALDLGKVTVVIPISSAGPLFALTLSAIFLRDVERVTLTIVFGALFIIGGVLLLTLWR